MKTNTLTYQFIEELRKRIPQSRKLTTALVDILGIEKEAVYRRLRGEVPFTFSEVAEISKNMNISIDNFFGGVASEINRPFQLKLLKYTEPTEEDFEELEYYLNILNSSRQEKDREIMECSNTFPYAIYLGYPFLAKFYLFKWIYQYEKPNELISYKEIEPHPRLKEMQKHYLIESKYIHKTHYVWDKLIFQYLVDDIKYFSSIYLITPEEVRQLKEDLLRFVDDVELMAARGCFPETGNKIYFYISNISFESNYWCIKTKNYSISIIRSLLLNGVFSFDTTAFNNIQNWINSLKRLSTLISESGEMQRILFFKRQREIINTL